LCIKVKDVAEQIHTLTSCRVFKTSYDKVPVWDEWAAEWDGDDEDGEGWDEEEEDEWYEEDGEDGEEEEEEEEEEGNKDGEPLASSSAFTTFTLPVPPLPVFCVIPPLQHTQRLTHHRWPMMQVGTMAGGREAKRSELVGCWEALQHSFSWLSAPAWREGREGRAGRVKTRSCTHTHCAGCGYLGLTALRPSFVTIKFFNAQIY
jgi:hypothetical protein